MTAIDPANQVRALKRDLKELLYNHGRAKMRFFVSAPNYGFRESFAQWFPTGKILPELPLDADYHAWTELYEDIATAVDAIRNSYIAPAQHLNNYLEWSALDIERDETKFEPEESSPPPSNLSRRMSGEAHAASILLAIKSGLDRLVRILSFYYPGIDGHTTWGRYDKKGKPSGFMAVVERGMLKDQFLGYLNAAYLSWIQLAIAPRDALIHYQEATSIWQFLPEEGVFIESQSIADADGQVHNYGIDILSYYVDEWYQLAEYVLLTLATRLPKERLTCLSSEPPPAAS